MTSRRTLSAAAGWLGLAGMTLFGVILIILHGDLEGGSWTTHYISEFAYGASGYPH